MRLIVNADDFGRSSEINHAVIRAHREGILTTASLMVNGRARDEAVRLAKENPGLGVGLHLSLVCGRSSLKPTEIPGLVNDRYRFSDSPVMAGLRYFLLPSLRVQLKQEIEAQFTKFRVTGLPMDHVNGHLNMHLHPTIFGMLKRRAEKLGITHFRLTRDPFWLNARLAFGNWFYRITHAFIFNALSMKAEPALKPRGVKYPRRVFGLLQNSRVDEKYITRLLQRLPSGDSELYSHPSLDQFKHEFDALVSPSVKSLIERLGIRLIRYQDL